MHHTISEFPCSTTSEPEYPWYEPFPTTAPSTPNTQPIYPTVTMPETTPGISVWPMPEDPPIPGTEEFHDFMCWLAGFTDPITPPSQERWEAFQEKVKEMAVLFWEYKKEQRMREFNQPVTLTTAMSANTSPSTGFSTM